ncbi:MAG TPA: peptidylprolyl isomerase [Glaciihabitans sp.]|nr:peptidylprolyl isomerase [Glaciihabitans sp.]
MQLKRRRRDNIVAGVALLIVAVLATTAQIYYFSEGPGTPAPSATATDTPTDETEANVGSVPSPDVAEARTWTGELVLNDIALSVSLDGALAPQAVASVVTDIQNGYYPSKTCHRLLLAETAKVLQCGSLDGTGLGDTAYSYGPIENAPEDGVYPAGTIAMARAESAYSQDHQFFITLSDSQFPTDGGGYTVIGSVTAGLDTLVTQVAAAGVADGSTDGAPAVATTITSFTIQ